MQRSLKTVGRPTFRNVWLLSLIHILIKATPLHTLPRIWILIIGGVLAAGLYCLLLPLLGCITREDLRQLRPSRRQEPPEVPEEPAAARTDW